MANALNSFRSPKFLEDLEFLNDLSSLTDLGQQPTEGQARSDVTESADPFVAHRDGPASADATPDLVVNDIVEEFRLNQVLEQARLATGATGAAIALVRGEEIVCRATSGSDAPGLGVYLDPRTGLSGLCIHTRQLQHCNDTETDPRVDPVASRRLGVKSIVVLPLMDGDELFGVLEILSSRPNAFGQSDLRNLQALSDRILGNRRQEWEATATLPHKGSGFFLHNLQVVVPPNQSHPSESDSRIARRERASKRNDILIPILGVLVLAAAVLLVILMGLRLGWFPDFRGSSPPNRASGPSARTDRTVLPPKELQRMSAPEAESGESEADGPGPKQRITAGTNPALPPSGGFTVYQDSGVKFRMPPSTPSPTRDSRTSQRSPALEGDEQR